MSNFNVFAAITAQEWRWCVRANARAQGTRWLAFFGAISRLGDGYIWYALIAVLATFGGATGALAGLHMALIGIISLLLYKVVKHSSRRPRPLAHQAGLRLSVAPLDEFSFPSGHTLHAVAFSLVACHYFPWLAWLLLPLSVAIAASRVVLGLHYPSDVLAACAMGFGLHALLLRWF
jgi:undecaprenyl-diphosphatase